MTTLRMVKLSAIRAEGYAVGEPAPCFFHCPCGEMVKAFDGEQSCSCGATYDGRGWMVESERWICNEPGCGVGMPAAARESHQALTDMHRILAGVAE